jgi:hypothetical protein
MSPKTGRRVFGLVGSLCLFVPVFVGALATSAAPTVSIRAQRWAGNLDAAGIELAMRTIETLPLEYRKQLVARLSPAERARTYIGHVDRFLSSYPDLTPDQVTFAREFQEVVSRPGALDWANRNPELTAKLGALETKAYGLFERGDAYELMRGLGPSDAARTVREPGFNRVLAWIGRLGTVSAETITCDCDWLTAEYPGGEDAWCQWAYNDPLSVCVHPADCTPSTNLCGPAGNDPCHDLCMTPIIGG